MGVDSQAISDQAHACLPTASVCGVNTPQVTFTEAVPGTRATTRSGETG